MHGYNMIEAQIYYPRYIYMVEPRVHYKLLVVVLQALIIVQAISYPSFIYVYTEGR